MNSKNPYHMFCLFLLLTIIPLLAWSQSSLAGENSNLPISENCAVYKAILDDFALEREIGYPESDPVNYYLMKSQIRYTSYLDMEEWPTFLLKRKQGVSKSTYLKWLNSWIGGLWTEAKNEVKLEPEALRYSRIMTRNEAWNGITLKWLSDDELQNLMRKNSKLESTSEEANTQKLGLFRFRNLEHQRNQAMDEYKKHPESSKIGKILKKDQFRWQERFHALKFTQISAMKENEFATIIQVDSTAWKHWVGLQSNLGPNNTLNCSIHSLGKHAGGIYDGLTNTLIYSNGRKEAINGSQFDWPDSIKQKIYQFHSFTEVGFDHTRTKALLVSSSSPTRKTGFGGGATMYYVQKIDGVWRVTHHKLLWVS